MAAQQDHVLLPVADLDAAKAKYYDLLKDLNYTIVGEGQHRQISGNGSKTVEFGPVGTSRVDLVLSQSDSATNYRRGGSPEHVVFPAMERHVVRDFYAHALDAGFKPVRRPEQDPETGMLTTTVRDVDGNRVEVRYDSFQSSPPPASNHINNWISSVNGDGVVAEPEEVASGQMSRQAHGMREAHHYPVRTSSVRTSSSARRSSGSVHSDHRSSGGSGSGFEKSTGKTVVGALLGAAAGAALAYTMVHAREDSKTLEAEHEARMDARDRVKTEARRSRYSQPMPTYNEPRRLDTARPEYRDRDSGYQSASSGGLSPPDADGRSFKYRSITYPGPAHEASPNSYRDRMDQKRDWDVRSRRSSSMSRHSSTNSESTIRPQRAASLQRRLPLTTLDPPRVPSSVPSSMCPPSIPSMPGGMTMAPRGRRISNSYSNTAPPPAASAQTSRRLARSRSRSRERRDDDRGSRDGGDRSGRQRRRHSVSSQTRYSQVDRSKPPPTAMAAPIPSDNSPPRRRRSSSARPPSNDGSVSTTRRAAQPSSESGRSGSRRQPTATTTTTYRYDRPPSPAQSAALTEKALHDVDRHSAYQPTGSKLDDLGSVAPGDSISVVGSQPRQPPRRDSRGRREVAAW